MCIRDRINTLLNGQKPEKKETATSSILVTRENMYDDKSQKALFSFEGTYAGPLLINNRLLVNTSNGYTFYVSPYTGKILGYIENGDGSSLPPVAAGSQMIITTVDADIIAYQ